MAPIYIEQDKFPEQGFNINAAIADVGPNNRENKEKLLFAGIIGGISLSGIKKI